MHTNCSRHEGDGNELKDHAGLGAEAGPLHPERKASLPPQP